MVFIWTLPVNMDTETNLQNTYSHILSSVILKTHPHPHLLVLFYPSLLFGNQLPYTLI